LWGNYGSRLFDVRRKNPTEDDMNYKTPFTKEQQMEQRKEKLTEVCICKSTNRGQIQNNNLLKQPKKRLDIHQNMK